MILEEGLTPATKYIVLPSMMSVALGGALLYHSHNIKNEYEASLERNHHSQIQTLNNVIEHLSEAEKALVSVENSGSYGAYRIQIKDLEQKVGQEIESIKADIPAFVLAEQKSLKNEMNNYNTIGWVFESIGLLGLAGYGLLRLIPISPI